MADCDTLQLAEDVGERGSLPENDLRFSTAKILKAATLELREGVAPLLSVSRAEHLVYPYTVPVTIGTAEYRMPPRAVGGSLRDVVFIGTDGNPQRMRQLSMDEVEQIGGTDATGTPDRYYVRGYNVRLVPIPNVTGTLSIPYYARPNKLVLPSQAIPIVEVNENSTTVTLTLEYDDPSALVPFPYNSPFLDVVRATPGFETLIPNGANFSPTNLGGGLVTITFNKSELTSQGPENGDYVCLPGQSPVPQIPVELHGLLAARTARRLIKATGDDRWQALEADVRELEDMAMNWLAPRVSGDTQQAGSSIGYAGILPFNAWGLGP